MHRLFERSQSRQSCSAPCRHVEPYLLGPNGQPVSFTRHLLTLGKRLCMILLVLRSTPLRSRMNSCLCSGEEIHRLVGSSTTHSRCCPAPDYRALSSGLRSESIINHLPWHARYGESPILSGCITLVHFS